MNIITTIQTALDGLNSEADLFLLERSRAENKELENTKDTIIVYPDWNGSNEQNSGAEILSTRLFNIDFKTPDEWDNSDDDSDLAYDSETSAAKIEAMETLANSVFSWINTNKDQFPELSSNLTWRMIAPILRANNATMTGASYQLTMNFIGSRTCDYQNT